MIHRFTSAICQSVILVCALHASLNDLIAQPLPISQEVLNIGSRSFSIDVPEQKEMKGGHLQGVQLAEQTLFVSGSSDGYGYLAIFKNEGSDYKFLGIKKLAPAPLNHAGGFQIAENWLAIGLEDPIKKNASVVQLIDISNGSTISAPPVYSMERDGYYKRSTAGSVALIKRDDHFLMAVGSWDCTTIDFYLSNHLDPYKADFEFKPWTSWDSREAIRKRWPSKEYGNYQNLQLTEDSTGLYITGFGLTSKGGDQADVFRLDVESNPYELMQKVGSYAVQCSGDVTFRNGSGFAAVDGRPSIIAVGRSLTPQVHIQVFPITAD